MAFERLEDGDNSFDALIAAQGYTGYESGEDIVEAGCPFECENREIQPNAPPQYGEDCPLDCKGAQDIPDEYKDDISEMEGRPRNTNPDEGDWLPEVRPNYQSPCSIPFPLKFPGDKAKGKAGDITVDLRPACVVHDRCYGTCGSRGLSSLGQTTHFECEFNFRINVMNECERAGKKAVTGSELSLVSECYDTAETLSRGTNTFGKKFKDSTQECCTEPPKTDDPLKELIEENS